MRGGAELTEHIARLQAAAGVLAGPSRTGGCTEDCACATAAVAPPSTYQFPPAHAVAEEAGEATVACDLQADGGDVVDRIDTCSGVLARASAHEAIDGGMAVTFGDVELAGTVAALAAAEYRCCSFGSYTLEFVMNRATKRRAAGVVAAAAVILGGLTVFTAPASAEPRYDIWKCWNAREEWVIPKTQFYACPLMSILIIDSYTGRNKYLLSGDCANQLWQNNRRATWQDAMARCTTRVF